MTNLGVFNRLVRLVRHVPPVYSALGALRRRFFVATRSSEWRSATASRHRGEPLALQIVGDSRFFLPGMVLNRALELRNVTLTTDLGPPVAIKWSPFSIYKIPEELRPGLPPVIINDTHFDCSKENVADHFLRVFGYSLAVDPTAHHGPMVRKSNMNAAHDGEIVDGPAAARDGFSFSRLVDNRIGHHVEDIRVPIIDGVVPFCYVKYRPLRIRFSSANTLCSLQWPQDLFSGAELNLIKAFARSIGLQYGEVDVLRDSLDGRIYIVDANNTPAGPPNRLPENEADIALALIGTTFVERFLVAEPFRRYCGSPTGEPASDLAQEMRTASR